MNRILSKPLIATWKPLPKAIGQDMNRPRSIVPEVGGSTPPMIFTRVDLPAVLAKRGDLFAFPDAERNIVEHTPHPDRCVILLDDPRQFDGSRLKRPQLSRRSARLHANGIDFRRRQDVFDGMGLLAWTHT